MSEKKDCGNHGYWWKPHKLFRRLFACLLGFIILVLFVILIIWLVLRPTSPKFYLQDVSVYQFNLSDPNYLSSVIQVTVSSRNPNDRIGIYYDKLDIYGEYKGQQVTVATELPTGYQGHKDIDVWSPYLYGTAVPMAPYLAASIEQDETAGFLLLDIKVHGRLRWKVGTWVSGHYHIDVTCPAFLTGGNGKGFKFQEITSCHVDV